MGQTIYWPQDEETSKSSVFLYHTALISVLQLLSVAVSFESSFFNLLFPLIIKENQIHHLFVLNIINSEAISVYFFVALNAISIKGLRSNTWLNM